MSYVVYETESTMRVRNPKTRKEFYETERAAKAARTRALRTSDVALAVAETNHYKANIARMVERVNIMSGKTFMESINTPLCCSPASETYWSM